LKEDHFQLDGMFRQVSDFILEQAVAVVSDKPVDVMLIGSGYAQGRSEVLAGQGEALVAVVGRADDHKQGRLAALEDFLEPPGKGYAAAVVIDMGQKRGAELPIRRLFARLAGPPRVRKQLTKLAAKGLGLPSIAADAARLAHGTGQALPETRAFQKKGFIEFGDEVTEKVQRQKLSVDLPHRLRLDVLKRVFSVEHLYPGELQKAETLDPAAEPQLIPYQYVTRVTFISSGG
jgi:hypothetical protein